MQQLSEVTIISASPVIATPLRHWLESGPQALPCHLFGTPDEEGGEGEEMATRATMSGIALIAPQRWREMAFWLPCLQQRFGFHAWLVLADLRLAGMFLPALERRLCTLVAPGSSPDRLRISLHCLSDRVALCPPALLAQLIANGAAGSSSGGVPLPTRKEIQCACAASFGLSNRQIARVLRLGEGTVKGHIHHLMRKLHLKSRGELSVYLEQALTPWPHSLS